MLDNQQENQYKETSLSKWIFRIIAVASIILLCFLTIKFEFHKLKNDKKSRDSAEKMLKDIKDSIESLQDAWNTIYYFYQTGDLIKIMKCSLSSKTESIKQENTLLMMYREDIKTQKTVKENDDITKFNDTKNVRCKGNVTINIGLKNDIYSHPKNSKSYTFRLGEEPLELLEKYPFIKEALGRLRIGERATFIALPAKKATFKPQERTIYEMSIPNIPSTEATNIPLHMSVNKNDDKFEIDNRVVCGSVVSFLFKITDINGNNIYLPNKIERVKVGSGLLNDNIEQVMTKMRIGDRYKILLTKQMFKPTEILNENFFKKNEIIIFDLIIVNVQK